MYNGMYTETAIIIENVYENKQWDELILLSRAYIEIITENRYMFYLLLDCT